MVWSQLHSSDPAAQAFVEPGSLPTLLFTVNPAASIVVIIIIFIFFFNDTTTTEIYTLALHDALPISLPYSQR